MNPAQPLGTLWLSFAKDRPKDDLAAVSSLSGVAISGDVLWLAGDESRALHELRAKDNGCWGDHRRYPLSELFPGQLADDGEADLEGLAVDDGALWLVGSHALRRSQPKSCGKASAPREALGLKSSQPNRVLLGRIEIAANGRELVNGSGRCLPITNGGTMLTAALAADDLLKPFLALPSKDNGLDIEGLAVRGKRLFLGLRGPVLRGWALIVHAKWKMDGDALTLEAGKDDRLYRLHALDLGGLGIRDLAPDPNSDDLWILAGPTMALDGPMRVFRWPDGLLAKDEHCVGADRLEWCLDLPVGRMADHPEGIALMPEAKGIPRRLLVVYDTPATGRVADDRHYQADLFRLPGS